MMNLSESDTILLNSYLMLCRGSLLLHQQDTVKTIVFQEIEWRDINIVVFPELFLELFGDPEEGLSEHCLESCVETFLDKVVNDRFSPWLSWIFVGEIDFLEELELYVNFFLGSSESIEASLVSTLRISYLPDSVFWEVFETIKGRLNAVLSALSFEKFPIPNLPSGLQNHLQDCLGSLPPLRLDSEKTIVQSLYDDRLAQANWWKTLGGQSFRDEQWSTAVQAYQSAIQCNPFVPPFWADLGSSFFKLQDYKAAKYALQKAIVMDLPKSIYFYTLGCIEEELGNHEGAIDAYQHSLEIDPENLNSYCGLGNLLSALEEWDAAEAVYREGLEKSIWHFGIYLNLGNLFLKTDRPVQAIQSYKKALQLAPNNPEVLNNLALAYQDQPSFYFFYQGKCLESQHQETEAIVAYERSLNADPHCFESVLSLCECYQTLKQTDLARQTIEKSLDSLAELFPLKSEVLRPLLLYLNKQNESYLSRNLSKHYPFFKTPEIQTLLECINFPILYDHLDEISGFRQRFEEAIDAVFRLDFNNILIEDELFNFFRSFIHAFLNYQGENDRDIQAKCATIVESLLALRYPHWTVPLASRPILPQDKIRIGYASYYLRRHNGSRWALGWVQHHDPERFEVYTYHFGEILDGYTKAFCDASFQFKHLADTEFESFEDWLKEAIQSIKNDRLDLLIFPDLGMEPRTYLLSKLRLAPIQCTAWGHPITSGSKFIDYYLSSHLMESETAQHHYTEKLVRLPHLGLCYPTPLIPEPCQQRSFFQLPEDRVLYLSCQSLFKYLPQYDFIYPEIAKQVPQAYFVFLETFLLGEKLSFRLQDSFQKVGLSSSEYCQILPKQSWENYLQLQYVADIYLDTIAWSGGNSTLEAVACGLPVVTYPGFSMRSRHSYAILQRLGVTETIAHSLEEYIEIASELGRNSIWRQHLSEHYKARSHRLFDDRMVTQSLDQLLLTLINY